MCLGTSRESSRRSESSRRGSCSAAKHVKVGWSEVFWLAGVMAVHLYLHQ